MTIKIKKNISKKELANNIKIKIGLSSKKIQEVTDDLIDIIMDILIIQKKVNIKNFGSFKIIFKDKREGRNPKTKEKFTISSRNVIKFVSSDILKQKIREL